MTSASQIASLFRRSNQLRRILRAYRYWSAVRRLRGPRIIRRFAKLYPEAFFLQIGANDGEQLDPLREAVLTKSWRGIMVEPVPYVFERLSENNGHLAERVVLENVAIADVCGTLPFWHLQQADHPEEVPRLYDALGSFRKDIILKHVNLIPDIEQRLTCTEVPCITFNELCRRNRVEDIDLVQIDTEGYDFEIIKQIDFDRFVPTLLIYEHHHFDEKTRQACRHHLSERGYECFEEGLDTWCLQTRVSDKRRKKLIDYWRRLESKTATAMVAAT